MNGCRYCVIMHHRKRRGRKLARGVAMCLAQAEMTRCEKPWDERGPGCELHDARATETNEPAPEPLPPIVYLRVNTPRKNAASPAAFTARVRR
jgi:hypothetical protein